MNRPDPNQPFVYEGFAGPNGTIVPDDVFDVLAPRLSEAELRVLLYIVRRTFGFGKNADAISLRQLTDGIVTRDGRILDYGTGMSRKGVIGGIKGLVTKGIISVHKAVTGDGDSEINTYSLRFKDGVVTRGNYPGNRNTPPLVTKGNPQDSASQDSESQQHSPGPEPGQTGALGSVVVDSVDHTYGRPDLYDTLRDLGIHHHTVSKLLREHDHDFIGRMCEYTAQRLEQGWAPHDSVAAWVVAAVRHRYDLPADFRSRAEQEAARAELRAAAAEERTQAVEAMTRAEDSAREQLQRQRQERLAALGIEPAVDATWQAVQARLRETGEWSLALPLCFLQQVQSGVAILLAPPKVRGRIEGALPALERALGETVGERVTVVVREADGGPTPGLLRRPTPPGAC